MKIVHDAGILLVPGTCQLDPLEWDSMLTISSVQSSAWGGAGLLVLQGNLDSLDAIKLGRAIEALHAQGVCDVLVDISEVSYVSSQGWGVFASRLHHGGTAARFRFFGMRPAVLDTLRVIGIDRIPGIELHPSFDAAIGSSRDEAVEGVEEDV